MRDTTARLSSVERTLAMPHAMEGGALRRIPLYKSDRTMHAAGGHATTARDLARFVIAHLNEGRVRGAQGVPGSAIAASQRREIDQDRGFSFVHRNGWGLGLDIADYRELPYWLGARVCRALWTRGKACQVHDLDVT